MGKGNDRMDVTRLNDPVRPGEHTGLQVHVLDVGLSDLRRLLLLVDGVSDVRGRPLLARWGDDRLRFRYNGRDWKVLEPFGDNSRYWIVREDATPTAVEIRSIETVLASHRPPLHRRILAGTLGLRWFSRRS